MLMYEVSLLIYLKRNINLHEYDTNFIKETISDISYCTTSCVCSMQIYDLTIFCFLFYWHVTYFVLGGKWHVHTNVSQDFADVFFQHFYVEILKAKSIKSNFSAFISLFLSRIIENEYWPRLSTCSQDSITLH